MIIYNFCNQINGKHVDMLVPAANFAMYNSIANVRKFLHMTRASIASIKINLITILYYSTASFFILWWLISSVLVHSSL